MYDLGDVVHLEAAETDADGNAADVSDLEVTVLQPDGTATVPAPPDVLSTGSWRLEFTPTQAGRHVARWLGDGFAYVDVFNVWPADPRLLFGLTQAKAQLRQRTPRRGDDEQLRLYAAAVTPVIEDIVGPLVAQTRAKIYDGGVDAVLLPVRDIDPAQVSVTESGEQLQSGSFTVNGVAGIVYGGAQLAPRPFRYGRQNLVVTYQVGSSAIPPNVLLAALEEFRFLYQIGQQSPRAAFNSAEQGQVEAWTPSGFAVPRRVIELCGPQSLVGGFA